MCLCILYLIMSQIDALLSYSSTQWFMNAVSTLSIFQCFLLFLRYITFLHSTKAIVTKNINHHF